MLTHILSQHNDTPAIATVFYVENNVNLKLSWLIGIKFDQIID